MDLFSPARLTGSGRPVLAEGEIELVMSSPCDIYDEKGTKVHKGGSATATTRRILYLKQSENIAISLDLGALVSRVDTKSPIFGSPKVELVLQGGKVIAINFSSSRERDRFHKALHSALPAAKQAHTAATAPKQAAPAPAASAPAAAPAAAGIAGILERRAAEKRDTDVALKQAFSDLDSLIANAQKAVSIAEKLQTKTAAASAADSGSSLGSNSAPAAAGKEQELVDVALNLGIASPVTRSGAGAAYHDQLARELCDFFSPLLPRAGGMISLTDAFCLVCRARGSELVSPEDLLAACRLWEKLGLPMRLHQFPATGVLVIHSLAAGAEKVAENVFIAVEKAGSKGAAAAEIAEQIKVSLSLVKAHLKELEFEQRRICRDEAASAVRFYPNRYWV